MQLFLHSTAFPSVGSIPFRIQRPLLWGSWLRRSWSSLCWLVFTIRGHQLYRKMCRSPSMQKIEPLLEAISPSQECARQAGPYFSISNHKSNDISKSYISCQPLAKITWDPKYICSMSPHICLYLLFSHTQLVTWEIFVDFSLLGT